MIENLMARWLFVSRVFKGSITYNEASELELDELEWLYEQAEDTQAKMLKEAKAARTRQYLGRSRRR